MRVSNFEPVYDVRVENFNPHGHFRESAVMARLAIHGFNGETDRFSQVIEVLDRIIGQYDNPVIERLPRSKVKRLPPFLRLGAGEGIPKKATPWHQDMDRGSSWFREPVGVFFLQSQLTLEKRPVCHIEPID